MTNVIEFLPASRRRPGRPGLAEEAEILFFTGIRYEREADGLEEPADVSAAALSRPTPTSSVELDRTERRLA